MIFQAAGPASLGVLEAAEENGFLAIGVDTDQGYMQPGHIVSSMLKRVDTSIYDIIEKCKNGGGTGICLCIQCGQRRNLSGR